MKIFYFISVLLLTLTLADSQTTDSSSLGETTTNLFTVSNASYAVPPDPNQNSTFILNTADISTEATTPDGNTTAITTSVVTMETSTSTSSSTSTTTKPETTTKKKNLGLILGLSLGLGIPALIATVAGVTFYCYKRKNSNITL
ncbi:unnamed protein product [Adineta ricciae]|uniref:Mid2 domain-containing protein n=1 Tax=Adineta ricciae TaxID=249248 RepID=A0A813PM22_ADIRI|nr:unnamed protein product [Adineta ricciae]CAF1352716.1 unnamed protein product [Adineta ricciae]